MQQLSLREPPDASCVVEGLDGLQRGFAIVHLDFAFGLRSAEGHIDLLKAFGPLRFCLPRISLAVGDGEIDVIGERGQQRPRMKAIHPHNVDLGAQHQRRGHQEQERQHAQHQ